MKQIVVPPVVPTPLESLNSPPVQVARRKTKSSVLSPLLSSQHRTPSPRNRESQGDDEQQTQSEEEKAERLAALKVLEPTISSNSNNAYSFILPTIQSDATTLMQVAFAKPPLLEMPYPAYQTHYPKTSSLLILMRSRMCNRYSNLASKVPVHPPHAQTPPPQSSS